MSLVVGYRVGATIQIGIDSNAENVLVVGSQHTGRDDGAVGRGLVGVDVLRREDSCGAKLEVAPASLIELPVELLSNPSASRKPIAGKYTTHNVLVVGCSPMSCDRHRTEKEATTYQQSR